MGISQSASKRVATTLTNSSEFNSACDSAYTHCLSLTEQAFPGVLPYQLFTAATHLHQTLTSLHPHPLILRWVPDPPTRSQVDSALRVITSHQRNPRNDEEQLVLGATQFREWAVVLFADAVVGNAGKAVLKRVPVGVLGIVGIGAAARSGKEVVGAAIGVYALGVATSIYLSLSGNSVDRLSLTVRFVVWNIIWMLMSYWVDEIPNWII
ncbi:uncharacterized protein LOC111307716 isoform X2 [Durio zibethinus]|uniref:Uncharacterized protein LOC111307716 isoform X2 n=1 Tax=Durio zibethinus TaxID=66656 RepID=A0A6P6A9P8_DURZI|nr:uncharacterized protein LOC111307716 isoform X2 [Durio zibethinus]